MLLEMKTIAKETSTKKLLDPEQEQQQNLLVPLWLWNKICMQAIPGSPYPKEFKQLRFCITIIIAFML